MKAKRSSRKKCRRKLSVELDVFSEELNELLSTMGQNLYFLGRGFLLFTGIILFVKFPQLSSDFSILFLCLCIFFDQPRKHRYLGKWKALALFGTAAFVLKAFEFYLLERQKVNVYVANIVKIVSVFVAVLGSGFYVPNNKRSTFFLLPFISLRRELEHNGWLKTDSGSAYHQHVFVIKKLAEFMKPCIPMSIIQVLVSACFSWLAVLQGQLYGKLYDTVLDEYTQGSRQISLSEILPSIVIICALAFITPVVGYVRDYISEEIERRVTCVADKSIFRALLGKSLSFFEKTHTSEIFYSLQGIGNLENMSNLFQDTIGAVLVISFALIYLFQFNKIVALSTFAYVGGSMLNQLYNTQTESDQRMNLMKSRGEIMQLYSETISNSMLIKQFAAEHIQLSKFDSVAKTGLQHRVSYASKSREVNTIKEWVRLFLKYSLDLIFLFSVVTGNISLGEITFLVELKNQLEGGLQQLHNVHSNLKYVVPDLFRCFSMFDENEISIRFLPDKNDEIGINDEHFRGKLELRGVSFAYETNTESSEEIIIVDSESSLTVNSALNNVSMEINPGKFTALCGQSGCGKSTITKLLLRLYQPTRGRICLDGVDVEDLDRRWYHDRVTLVSQEPTFFLGSIADNITFGSESGSYSLQDIKRAAKLADAHEFISELEHGYDSELGENGVNLSVGQKQRIALARAFFRRPRILILDEATSALDLISESSIKQAVEGLNRESNGCLSVLAVAHRLNTIINADNIYFMNKDGTIAEEGTHEQLMNKRGGYYSMYKAQADPYASKATRKMIERHRHRGSCAERTPLRNKKEPIQTSN